MIPAFGIAQEGLRIAQVEASVAIPKMGIAQEDEGIVQEELGIGQEYEGIVQAETSFAIPNGKIASSPMKYLFSESRNSPSISAILKTPL